MKVEPRTEAERAKQQVAAGQDVFDMPTVLAVSAAHGVHDTYPAFLAPLLPLLIAKHGMGLTAAGGLATVLRLSTLIQPFLGLWADRADTRYFVIAAPAITALCMSFLGLAPNYLTIVALLAVTGLSHAAFHPAAASAVTRAGGSSSSWGRASSVYMTGGELGRSAGPIFIVWVVSQFGLERSYLAVGPGVLFSLLLFLRLRNKASTRIAGASAASIWAAMKEQRRPLLLLSGLILFRSTSVQSFSTFYPTYLISDRGSSLVFAGLAVSLYELAGAAGALAGGTLSDRFGRRALLLVSQLISGPLLYLALSNSQGPMGLLVLAAAGATAVSAGPVQLTLAQEILPGGRSTAAGIVFFLGFEGTLVSTLAVGALADWIGLGPALGFSVLASMLSIPFTLALPETRGGGRGA